MFRIRHIADDVLPLNQRVVSQVQDVLRSRLEGLPQHEVDALPEKLRDPLKYKLRALLFVADDGRANVKGFAVVSHAPDLRFCFLDYLVTAAVGGGSGVGSALYQRVRDVALALGATGLFFECLPDDASAGCAPAEVEENTARMRFYERFGARPIVHTGYEWPVTPDDRCLPHLMYDDLGTGKPLRRAAARRIVRAILERKYAHLCPPAYVKRVVASIREDPVELRPLRYHRVSATVAAQAERRLHQAIVLVVSDRHDIHHVRERGYVQSPVRIKSILEGIEPTRLFRRVEPRLHAESHIRAVHDPEFVAYLEKVCTQTGDTRSIYPYVFPVRNAARLPQDLALRAGYYCFDTFTPLNRSAWVAARRAVDCALTAADALLGGERLAYALVRPPGHHAERRSFGGFCYLNSAAIAAHYLSRHGPVAILDIDYHHGNGQQDVFYARADVLTLSLHGHPRFAFPYFSGFADERGEGPGLGFNHNYPLPEALNGEAYRESLRKALEHIEKFAPRHLVVALGFDTARGDPTGSWGLNARDFGLNAWLIGRLRLPTLVMQEGGYRTRTLAANARQFFLGLAEGAAPGKAGGFARWRGRAGGAAGAAGVGAAAEPGLGVEERADAEVAREVRGPVVGKAGA